MAANLALVTADRVRAVEIIQQLTMPAAEAITAGQAMRLDTSTGRWTKANGTAAGEARALGIALATVAAGFAVTGLIKGAIDGYALTALDYDAPVYLSDTDGTLADTAGTVTVVVGRVIPVSGRTVGGAHDKLLLVGLG
jgi:hypothetical protein